MESWGWPPFGCYLTFCRPPPSRQMSCIHPFVHPSISWPSVTLQDWKSLQSVLLEEAMVTRTVVLWRRCFGGDTNDAKTFSRWRSASCPPPLPSSHTDPNVSRRQKHWQAGTDVAAWAPRSVENAPLDVLPHRGLDCLFTTCWVVTLHTGWSNLRPAPELMISSRRATLPPRVNVKFERWREKKTAPHLLFYCL